MTLHLYFARRFLTVFLLTFGLFAVMLGLIDMLEQIRSFDLDGIGMWQILRLTLLNMPKGLYAILPLITILASVALFLNLSRSSELVVARAAGRSALRTLAAPVIVAWLLGALFVAGMNPIVAATSKQYEMLASRFKQGSTSVLSLSRDALWLRQGTDEGQMVIRAEGTNLDGTELRRASFLTLDPAGNPLSRIEAERAVLQPGFWQVSGAKIWTLAETINPELTARNEALVMLPSDLTVERIRDSFGTPSSVGIWELPQFIDQLEEAGFSARAHRTWLQMELALPLLMAAMVMVGAGFTMRHIRFGKTGVMVLMALGLGFAVFFLRNFAQVLGDRGQIPAELAAWAPPATAILLAVGLLLHLEDG